MIRTNVIRLSLLIVLLTITTSESFAKNNSTQNHSKSFLKQEITKKRTPSSSPIYKIVVSVSGHVNSSVFEIIKENNETRLIYKTNNLNRSRLINSADFSMIQNILQKKSTMFGDGCGDSAIIDADFFSKVKVTAEFKIQDCYSEDNIVSKEKVELLRDLLALIMI